MASRANKKKLKENAAQPSESAKIVDTQQKEVKIDSFKQCLIIACIVFLIAGIVFMCLPFSGMTMNIDFSQLAPSEETNEGDTTQDFHVVLSGLQIILIPFQNYDSVPYFFSKNLQEVVPSETNEEFVINAISAFYSQSELDSLYQIYVAICIICFLMFGVFLSMPFIMIFIRDTAKLSKGLFITNILNCILSFIVLLVLIIFSAATSQLIIANYGIFLYFIVSVASLATIIFINKKYKIERPLKGNKANA